MDSVNSLPNFPEKIRKYYECKFLHKKISVYTGEQIEIDGKLYDKLKWICKECENDNDTTKDKEAPRSSQSAIGIH